MPRSRWSFLYALGHFGSRIAKDPDQEPQEARIGFFHRDAGIEHAALNTRQFTFLHLQEELHLLGGRNARVGEPMKNIRNPSKSSGWILSTFLTTAPNRFTNHLGDHGGIAEIGIVEHQSFCHGKFLSLVK